jgi:hypothetical protein
MKTSNWTILGAALLLTMNQGNVSAQTQPTTAKPTAEATQAKPAAEAAPRRTSMCGPGSCTLKVFYLKNAAQANDANEIQVAIRLVDPGVNIYLVPSQNALIVQATPEVLQLTQSLIDQLDLPKKNYRLTYTITESDSGKRIGSQHFVMTPSEGQHIVLKQASKVPVETGSYSSCGGSSSNCTPPQKQYTYYDAGMNFDATLSKVANGVMLRTKVDRSGISGQGPESVIRSTSLEGTSFVVLGKPLMLGSLDIPGSTSHLDIEAEVELLP